MSRLLMLVAMFAGMHAFTSSAQTHVDPADVAERCAASMSRVAERAEREIVGETTDCLEKIRRLLAAGRVEAAHRVARQCHEQAEEVVRRASAEINSTYAECIRYLTSVGAYQLARRLDQHRESILEGLDALLDRQQQVLADVLS